MTHRKTYRIFEDEEKVLVYEDVLNESGQILSFQDHQSPDQAEGVNEYDAHGRLTCERDLVDGAEGSRTEYVYNESGNITSRKLLIAGELYEELSYEFLDNGFIQRRLQNGEEIERSIESKNGEKFLKEFFEGAELIERHKGEYDANKRISYIKVVDNAGNVLANRIQEFDVSENLLKYEEKSVKGNLLVLSEYKYKNNEVIHEIHNDYANDQHYEIFYEYDAAGNMISQEIKTPSGKLLEYQKKNT